jgi:hypothetical protein
MEPTKCEQKIEELISVLGEEAARLRLQRAHISNRIARIRHMIVGLKRLNGNGIDRLNTVTGKGPGVTGACRLVLMESRGRSLNLAEVFQAIQTKLAPAMLAHKDPRASVATIFGRLVRYGEVEVITDKRGKRAYRWSDRDYVTRQSYELVVPSRSHIDQVSTEADNETLQSDDKL